MRYFDAWLFGQPLVSRSVLNGVANLALIGTGIWGLIQGAKSQDLTVRRVSIYVLIAAILNLVLFAFTNAPSDGWSGRYVVFFPIAVVMGLTIGLSHSPAKNNVPRWGILALIVISVVAHMLALGDTAANLCNTTRTANERRILEALAETGLVYGYSDYWNSLNTTFYSGQTMRVWAISCDGGRLRPRDWWSQSRWYLPNVDHHPSFVLINVTEPTDLQGCGREALVRQFGPAKIMSIDRANIQIGEVFIWDYDIASMFAP